MCPTNHRECTPIFQTLKPLVLASKSPRRQELLKALGLEFEVVPSRFQEPPPGSAPPTKYVRFLAAAKAREVADRRPEKVILAADTIVVLDDQILGKPKDQEEAQRMLKGLSGRAHQVYTGYTILYKGLQICKVVTTEVVFKRLSPREIRAYLATGEPMDKAGAYAIQGLASYMVQEVRGSVTNVIGLPLTEVVEDLLSLGIIDFKEK